MAACWHIQTSPTAKAVLISLADNANDAGHCWPSISTIAERTCLEKTTVIRAIKRLEGEGYLIANRGNGRHTTYTLTVGDLSEPVAENNRLQSATGCTAPPNRLHSATQPVAQCNTNRKEPSRTKYKGTRFARPPLPDDWRAYGVKIKPNADIDAVYEDFCDYWVSIPGAKGIKADWFATWRTWVRRQFDSKGKTVVPDQFAGAK